MKHVLLMMTGILVWSSPSAATDRETREVFESYGQCVVDKDPGDAAEVVLSTMSTRDILKSRPSLIRPDCLHPGQQLVMPASDFLRYGLAVALVRRDFAAGLPSDIAKAGPIRHFELDDADYRPKPGKTAGASELARLDDKRKRDEAIRAISIYGECVARADPAASLKLVLSKTATKEESEAFLALGKALSFCLPQGQTITVDKEALRGTVAMNLYRLAEAPRIAAAAGKD